jgi:hypothetical protein
VICLQCSVSKNKICEFHFRLANNHHAEFDEWLLIDELKTALKDVQRPEHPRPCGTCAELIDKAERFQKQRSAT